MRWGGSRRRTRRHRLNQVPQCERILDEELEAFGEWLAQAKAGPTILQMYQDARALRDFELERLFKQNPELEPYRECDHVAGGATDGQVAAPVRVDGEAGGGGGKGGSVQFFGECAACVVRQAQEERIERAGLGEREEAMAQEQRQTKRPGEAAAPPLRLLFWESTAACNLACIHCRRLDVAQELSRDDLTTQEALTLIRSMPDAAPGSSKPILVFSGGEPLMRPDLFELAGAAVAMGLPIALATNGTMLDERIAQRVVDVGFRRVSMSLDGADAQTHDHFRGDGAFESTLRGFRELRRRGMSMQLNSTLSRHNVHQFDELYALALELGAEALHIFMLVPVGCGMELSPDVMLTAEEYETALNWIYDRSQEGRLHLKATCAARISFGW